MRGHVVTLPSSAVLNWKRDSLPSIIGVVWRRLSQLTSLGQFSDPSILSTADPIKRHCHVSSLLLKPGNRLCLVDDHRRRTDGTYGLTPSSIQILSHLKRYLSTFFPGYRPWLPIAVEISPLHSEDLKKEMGRKAGGKQSTNSILMVSPNGFAFNKETAVDNAFMSGNISDKGRRSVVDITASAMNEFRSLYTLLVVTADVKVHVFEDNPLEATPDAVFPNNWFTTHALDSDDNYSLVLYPMKSVNRRRERRKQMVDAIKAVSGDRGTLDLTHFEKKGQFLEGTGSLVLDRVNRLAFVSRSERSCIDLAHHWAQEMGYREVIHFDSHDFNGRPVYHTNVMMAIGTHFAIVCLEAITNGRQRNRVMDVLSQNRAVIAISQAQMSSFCGNVLELTDGEGRPILIMSSQAYNSFHPEQLQQIRQHVTQIHHTFIDTIERVGGGGVRCAIAELF